MIKNWYRTYQSILEAQQYPQTMTADEVVAKDAEHQKRDDDGAWEKMIHKFKTYELKDIPISEIDMEGQGHNPNKAEDIAKKPADELPPIIYDPEDRMIIDGFHRTHGAIVRGDTTIKGYCGVK